MRQPFCARRALVCACLPFLVMLGFLSGSAAAHGQALAIGSYHLQGSVRASLTQYDYTYTADVVNSGAALQGVIGTVQSSSPNTLIRKGMVNFGAVGANSTTTSTDTFTIRQDRRFTFDPSSLAWSFVATARPVANAGPNQTAGQGQTVTLNGTGSTDPLGHALTYSWSFVSMPAGSAAALANAASPMPTFVIDKFGDYVVQLVVSNGSEVSAPATVKISTSHTAPTANAGANQTAPEGALIQLDGSASTDPDGNPLTYMWSFVSVPTGSGATLSSTTAVKPTFTLDKFGSYVVQLIVSDQYLQSKASMVTITTTHTAPVANAGPSQSANVGQTVTLDGSLSKDTDGFPLTYSWSLLNVPAGSAASLTGATGIHPTFVLDVAGSYIAQLIVNDGFNSSVPATVTISTQLLAPTAAAGPAQTVPFQSVVHLDGSGSSDPNHLPLTYAWTFLTKPVGSAASLSDAGAAQPTFTADKQGTYVAQLIVNDGTYSSTPSTVSITVSAAVPVANAGANQTVAVGDTVSLSGLASTDPSGNPLTYAWTFVTTPSTAPPLNGAATASPSFVAAVGGTYTLQLVVNNGTNNSQPSTVQITAVVPALTLNATLLTFSDQAVGTSSAAKSVLVTNNSAVPVTFGGIGASGDFSAGLTSTCGATLPAGANCSISILFSPSAPGPRTGTLALNDNAAGTPQTVSLAGTGIAGTATKLVIGTQPVSTTAATVFSPAITVLIEDAGGNTVTSANGAVTLTLGNNPGGGTLSGTAVTNAVNGVATFSGLSINKVGTGYTLVATASGLTAATTSAFNITPGAAAKLAFSAQPANVVAGAVLTPPVTVTIQDAGGNTVLSATTSITLALGSNPGSGTLTGTLTAAAVNGVATFSSLSINNAGIGYTLTAAAAGLTGATSGTFNVTAGAATQAVFSTQPSTTSAGAPITPAVVVTLEDAQGNVVTSATNTVSIGLAANPGGGSLAGTLNAAAVNGVATFSNLSIAKAATGYILQASSAGLSSAQSTSFNITAGPAAKLAFVTQPSNVATGASITPAVTVAIEDVNGNVLTNASTPVTVAIGNNPSSGTLAGTLTVNALNGVATFAGLSINNAGTGYTLTAASAGLTGASSTAFTVTPGTASKLAFTVQPSSTASGVSITPAIAVSVEDAGGNVVTSSTVPITLSFAANPGGSGLTGTLTVNAVNGVATFANISIDRAASGYVLQANSPALSGAQSTAFSITPGPAAKLFFPGYPNNTPAGSTLTPTPTVTILDAAGNTVTSATNTVTLALLTNTGNGTLNGTLSVSAVAGIATFPGLSISSAGNYSLSASSAGLTGTNGGGFTITAGPATKLAFITQPSTTAAGAPISTVQVALQDVTGTTNFTATNVVTLALGTNPSSGTLAGTVSAAAVNGVATFTGLSINNPGTGYTLAASSTGLTSATSNPFNVTGLVLTISPSSLLVGVGTSLSGTVSLAQPAPAGGVVVSLASSNTANVTISPATLTFVQGQTAANFSYTGVSAGPANLSASASGYATNSVTVTATASLISLGSTGNITVGQTVSLPLSLGTPAPTGGLTVNLTSSNTALATITASVFIPAGSKIPAANPQITALAIGTLQITANASAFAPNGESITIIAPLATLTPSPVAAHQTLVSTITLNLSSPAPPGGTSFTLATDNTAIATVVSPVIVTAGSTTASVSVTGVGIGSTTLRANSPGIAEATATIDVTAAPTITVTPGIVGNNLVQSVSISLSVAPSVNQSLTLTSADPTHFLLSTSSTAVGSASVTVQLTAGSGGVPTIYIEGQNYSGTTAITGLLTATSSGFVNGSGTASLYPTGFGFITGSFTTTSFSANTALTEYLAVLNPGTLTVNTYGYGLGPQAPAVSLAVASSTPATGTILGSPLSFAPGSYYNNTSISFHPVDAGTTNLTLTQPAGFYTPSGSFLAQITATVTAPAITVNPGIIGNNLVQSLSISLAAPPQSNQTLTVTSADPTHFLLSTSATTVGTASVTVQLTAGSASVPSIYIEGQNYSGTTAITGMVTVTSSGFTTGTGTASLYPTGFGFNNSSFTTTSFSANTTLTAYLATLTPGTLAYYTYGYGLGPQAPAVSLVVASSTTATGTILGSPASFAPGTYYNNTSISFHPVGAGTTNLTLTQPAGFYTPSSSFLAQITATVTAPAITVTPGVIGNNLVQGLSISLAAPPQSNQTLTVTSADPTHFLLSTSATTVGTASVTVQLTAGSQSVPSIYIEGQNYSGTTAITGMVTVTSSGFTTGTGTASLYPTGFGSNSSSFTTTSFSANTTLTEYLAILTPGTLAYYTYGYGLGPQAPAVSLAVASSTTATGTILGSPASFAPGTYYNQAISFHPVAAGTTNLTLTQPAGFYTPASSFFAQITATVTAPAITVSPGIIGNNTVTALSISLAAPPPSNETLTITSTDPTHFLLSTSATAVGSASVTVQLTAGSQSVPTVYIEGQNFAGNIAVTGTITASAAGYSDGGGVATLYPTGLGLIGGSTISTTVSSPVYTNNVYLLLLNPGSLTYYTYGYGVGPQAGAIPVAFTNANPSVGTLSGNPTSMPVGSYYVASAIRFTPTTTGTAVLTVVEPPGYFTPTNEPTTDTVTVTP